MFVLNFLLEKAALVGAWSRGFGLASLAAAAALAGCARHSVAEEKATLVSPSSSVIEILVSNRTHAPAPLVVQVDGRPVFSGWLAPREQRRTGSIAGNGSWHRIVSRSGDRPPHQALVRSDRKKWVTIKVDSARREGVGVHVSENGW